MLVGLDVACVVSFVVAEVLTASVVLVAGVVFVLLALSAEVKPADGSAAEESQVLIWHIKHIENNVYPYAVQGVLLDLWFGHEPLDWSDPDGSDVTTNRPTRVVGFIVAEVLAESVVLVAGVVSVSLPPSLEV